MTVLAQSNTCPGIDISRNRHISIPINSYCSPSHLPSAYSPNNSTSIARLLARSSSVELSLKT